MSKNFPNYVLGTTAVAITALALFHYALYRNKPSRVRDVLITLVALSAIALTVAFTTHVTAEWKSLISGLLVGSAGFSLVHLFKYRKMHPTELMFLEQMGNVPCIQQTGATYPTQGGGIVDLAMVQQHEKGAIACIVDGSGHNMPLMRGPLEKHFHSFMAGYFVTKGAPSKLDTLREVETHFTNKIRELEARFRDRNLVIDGERVNQTKLVQRYVGNADAEIGTFLDPSRQPALSFVHFVKLKDGRKILLTAQAGDTRILVEKEDGTFLPTQTISRNGVGHQSGMTISFFDITGAKRIMGISDGIHDHLNDHELAVIMHQTSSNELFAALQTRVEASQILKKHERRSEIEAGNKRRKADAPAVDPLDPENYADLEDDIGLFVLDVGP
jgi:hypothetical protein